MQSRPDRVLTFVNDDGTTPHGQPSAAAIAPRPGRWWFVVGWATGISGVMYGFSGQAGYYLAQPQVAPAQLGVVTVSLVAAAMAWWLWGHWWGPPLVLGAGTIGLVGATAPNAGRAAGLVAAASLTAALAAWTGWPRRGRPGPFAITVALAAQPLWVRTQAPGPTLAVLAAALATALLAQPSGSPLRAGEAALGDAIRRATTCSAGVVRRWAGWAADRAMAGAAHLRRACRRPSRRSVLDLIVGLGVGLLWAPLTWRLTQQGDAINALGINDYPLHLEVARNFRWMPLVIEGPHLLFHLVTATFAPLVGADLAPVATIVAATTGAYLALLHLLRRRATDGIALTEGPSRGLAALYFFLETPALALIGLGVVSQSSPFVTVHWWGNPTWLVSVPFALLALPLLEDAIALAERRAPLPGRLRWALLATIALGALAKPGLAIALMPALPIYVLAIRRSPAALRAVAPWALGPAVAVVAWQSWFLRASEDSRFSTSWAINPIVEPVVGWERMRSPVFWLPVLVIALAAWASQGRYWQEPSVALTAVCAGVGLAMMLILEETGERASHGNNSVVLQTCIALLVVLGLRSCSWEVARWWREPRRTIPPLRVIAVFVVAVLFAIGGSLSYLHGVGALDLHLTWESTVG